MDPSVDPGADFYRYANGQWLKSREIPADQVSWSPTVQLIERNTFLGREILESCAAAAERDPVSRRLGDYYAAAMDTARIEQRGFSPLAADFAAITALRSKDDLPELLADFHAKGIDAVFGIRVSADERQSSVYALQLGQGGLGLPDRDYYFEKRFRKERQAYRRHIARMLTLLGDPPDRIAGTVADILSIETALAAGSKKLEQLSDPVSNYHKFTVPEWQKAVPQLDWARYFQKRGTGKLNYLLAGQPDFFRVAGNLIRTRPLAQWKNYLRWQVVNEAAPLLHGAADRENFAFYGTVLNGQPRQDPRWKRAANWVNSALGEEFGQLYVNRYFQGDATRRMRELVANLTAVYRDRLAAVPWMTAATRARAVEKFERFSAKIGAPDKPRDYSGIEVRRDDFFGNLERAALFEDRRALARIGQPVDRTEWGMTAPTVNAYFDTTLNEIVFPAGILQPPFFDPQMDDAVNYGATGATIGHEMTHGYDSEGRKYDASGNLRDWWTPQDTREFDARAQKLVAHFNSFEVLPGCHVNGKLTLAENIADLGGLSIAFEALERALDKDPSKRQSIDGFTPEQRFFLSYAQSWAGKYRASYLRQSLTTDTHAPDVLRGYVPLLHLQPFYDAFAIKASAPLFLPPKRRAIIW